jgi:hypothetical protein
MTHSLLESWKTWALADAERRGLPGLKPILEGLATSTARLRATRWQPAPDQPDSPHGADPPHSPKPDTHGR